jgi:hypothetical protein
MINSPIIRLCLFSGEGRLGNQIIQLAALRKLYPAAVIVSFGAASFSAMFRSDKLIALRLPSAIEKTIRLIVFPLILRPLSFWLHLFHYCTEGTERCGEKAYPGGHPLQRGGMLPIVAAEKLYFQNFRDLLRKDDFAWLGKSLAPEATGRKTERATDSIVMHVRRTDYLGFSTHGVTDVVLPRRYYVSAVAHIRRAIGRDLPLRIVTDDPAWVATELSDLGDATILSGSETDDFLTIAGATYLVCSNSSFALSAALISSELKKCVAPKYWLGHAVHRWIPPSIEIADSSLFEYI